MRRRREDSLSCTPLLRSLSATLAALVLGGCATAGPEPELFANALGNGDCAVSEQGRIECASCNPGWTGRRCNECVEPRRCGTRPETVHRGVVTRYYRPGPAPAWRQAVFAASLPYRSIDELEPVDNAHERAEDARRGITNRLAARRSVPAPLAAADWQSDAEGRRLWTRGYRSRGAESLIAVLEGIRLAEGAELWLYTEQAVHGPVTRRDLAGGVHATPPLPGDLLYLEIREPPGPGGATAIDGLSIGHSYGGGSIPCQVDVACFPGAETQANGVAAIYINTPGGTFHCTGSLLNTAEGQPLLLTAEHCLWDDPGEYFDYILDAEEPNPAGIINFGSSLFVFHYRNQSCNPPSQDDQNDIWNALSFSGAEVELHDHETDIGLLTLSQTPDPQCVTYLGYNSAASTPSYTAGISHPDGLLAQIHVDWDAPGISDYMDLDPQIEAAYVEDDTYYRQTFGSGDHGWPQGGSSGSPVFDTNGRVIAQLSGHWPVDGPNCSAQLGWMSGRLSRSVAIIPNLGGLLGASSLDAAANTATSALPLHQGNPAPCVNNSYWYIINPRVADNFDIDWQIVAGTAEIVDVSADQRQARILFGGSGNPVPTVTIRITVTNPCYEDVRNVQVEPTFCM